MAHRQIIRAVLTGARVFQVAASAAWKQANAAKVAGASRGSSSPATAKSAGLTLDEACKILNVGPPKGGKTDTDHLMERFKTMFDQNDPNKGGSFYLQSKILRARERIESEVRQSDEKAEFDKEIKDGWKPKIYKDR